MDRVRNRKNDHKKAAELDVTPFMNLMIVLVPVLLLSMVFTHTTVIDLNFPTGASADSAFDPDAVHLEVVVLLWEDPHQLEGQHRLVARYQVLVGVQLLLGEGVLLGEVQ